LLQTGDVQWSGYQLTTMVHTRLGYGTPVLQLLHRLPRYYQWAYKNNHHFVMRTLQAAQLPLLNLIGATTGELDFDAPRVVTDAIQAVKQLVEEGKQLGISAGSAGSTSGSENASDSSKGSGVKPKVRRAAESPHDATPGEVAQASSAITAAVNELDNGGTQPRPIDDMTTSTMAATSSEPRLVSAGPGATAAQDAKAAAAATNSSGESSTHLSSSAAREQRLALISSAMTEAEFISDCEQAKLWTPLAIFRIWQSRCYYLYGHYDLAWTSIKKAISLREYIVGLTPMVEMVQVAALILLAKIGMIDIARQTRKREAHAAKTAAALIAKSTTSKSTTTTTEKREKEKEKETKEPQENKDGLSFGTHVRGGLVNGHVQAPPKDQQELVVMVGYPSSGKSTFAINNLVSLGYEHIE
jgi:hypothetical protein